MDTVIDVKNLSKKYVIRHEDKRTNDTLRDAITNMVKMSGENIIRPFKRASKQRIYKEEFWALRNISFKVNKGERIGIIGRNGAGKSTLLKLLSRITEPSDGSIHIKGRVSSLLEVGTGFHPELTGRENVLLNGAILGMSKNEIYSKFNDIVEFSGVKKFLDTPVKRYSSGMQVRLAFSVAAHLEPEILLVDEVLAVGDAAFQKKCLGKMDEVAKRGRTILFVSHNMAAISAFCSRAIVLDSGSIYFDGNVNDAIQNYLLEVSPNTKANGLLSYEKRSGEGKILITGFEIFDTKGNKLDFIISGQTLEFRIYYECQDDYTASELWAAIAIYHQQGFVVTDLSNYWAGDSFNKVKGKGYVSCFLPKFTLGPNNYKCNITLRDEIDIQDWIKEAFDLKVEAGDFYGTGRIPPLSHSGTLIEQDWSLKL